MTALAELRQITNGMDKRSTDRPPNSSPASVTKVFWTTATGATSLSGSARRSSSSPSRCYLDRTRPAGSCSIPTPIRGTRTGWRDHRRLSAARLSPADVGRDVALASCHDRRPQFWRNVGSAARAGFPSRGSRARPRARRASADHPRVAPARPRPARARRLPRSAPPTAFGEPEHRNR